MSTITIDGYMLKYTVLGSHSALPLIMIHGWFSHRGVWQETMEEFKDNYYCVAVDLLGFGDSEKPTDADYSIKAQGERILALAEEFDFDCFSLLGHSMGGQIAMYIASTLAPEKVEKLVSVSGVVSGRLSPFVESMIYPVIAMSVAFPRLMSMWRFLNRYRWYVNFHFRSWFYKMDSIPFSDWEIDRRMALQPGILMPSYKAGQAIHHLNLEPELAKIEAPTLVIFGKEDGTVPVNDGHLVEQYVMDSRLVLIDECGHFPMYEKPSAYLEALRTFLLD